MDKINRKRMHFKYDEVGNQIPKIAIDALFNYFSSISCASCIHLRNISYLGNVCENKDTNIFNIADSEIQSCIKFEG